MSKLFVVISTAVLFVAGSAFAQTTTLSSPNAPNARIPRRRAQLEPIARQDKPRPTRQALPNRASRQATLPGARRVRAAKKIQSTPVRPDRNAESHWQGRRSDFELLASALGGLWRCS